jgi:hypothetical protein
MERHMCSIFDPVSIASDHDGFGDCGDVDAAEASLEDDY